MKLLAIGIWILCNGRGEVDNGIKELKCDLGFGSFNLESFFTPEAVLTFAIKGIRFFSQIV